MVTLEEAILDSPIYRANLRLFEDQVDELERFLQGLNNTLKDYVADLTRYNETAVNLAKKTIPSTTFDLIIDSEYTMQAIKSFSDTINAGLAARSTLVARVDKEMIAPLTKVLKEDFKQFKEGRRNHERMLDKYELMLSKYMGQSKAKEASALREDAFQLYEVRKAYIKAAMDYTLQCIEFRHILDSNIVERFMQGWEAMLDKSRSSNSSPSLDARPRDQLARLHEWSKDMKHTVEVKMQDARVLKQKLEDAAILNAKPNRSLSVYSSLPKSVQAATSAITKPPSKSGYLNMRMSVGKPARNVWVKRWFFVRNGTFGYCTLGQGRFRTVVEESEKIGILLCEAKLESSQERRFCFEVQCSKLTSFLLQAETEQDLTDWIQIFEQAKRFVIETTPTVDLSNSAAAIVTHGPSPGMLALGATSDNIRANDDESGGYNTMAESNSAVGSTPSGPTQVQQRSRGSFSAAGGNPATMTISSSVPSLSDTKAPTIGVALQSQLSMMLARDAAAQALSAINSSTTSQGGVWGVPWSTLVPGIGLTLLGIGNEGVSQANGGLNLVQPEKTVNVGSGRDEIKNYTQVLILHDTQFHVLFPEVPKVERALNAFPNIFSSDKLHFPGHMYLTEKRLAFYSNIVGTVTKVMIPWGDVTHIESKSKKTYEAIIIKTLRNGQYTFKTYLRSASVELNQMKIIWRHDEEGEALQALFDKVRNVEKDFQKGHTEGMESSSVGEEEDEEESDGSHGHIGLSDSEGVNATGDLSGTGRKKLARSLSEMSKLKQLNNDSYKDDPDVIPLDRMPALLSVTCGCSDHLEKLEVEETFNVPAKKLYDVIFRDSSEFWVKLHIRKGDKMLSKSSWNEEGKRRELKYKMIINNPMSKVKQTECIETQELLKHDEFLTYVVQAGTKAAAIPYSDAFTPYIRYCITHVSRTRCKLQCHIGVKFWKNPMVKAIIRKAAMQGIAETSNDVVTLAREELQQFEYLYGLSTSRQSSLVLREERRRRGRRLPLRVISTRGPLSKDMKRSPLGPKPRGKTEWFLVAVQSTVGNAMNTIFGLLSELLVQRVLICLILISLFINITTFGWTNKNYMQQMRLFDMFQFPRIRHKPTKYSVFLSDLEETFLGSSSSSSSLASLFNQTETIVSPGILLNGTCYKTFKTEDWRKLDNERERIGKKRYELMLEFKLFNRMEVEIIKRGYAKWLVGEVTHCSDVKSKLGKVNGKVVDYCNSCEKDLKTMIG